MSELEFGSCGSPSSFIDLLTGWIQNILNHVEIRQVDMGHYPSEDILLSFTLRLLPIQTSFV